MHEQHHMLQQPLQQQGQQQLQQCQQQLQTAQTKLASQQKQIETQQQKIETLQAQLQQQNLQVLLGANWTAVASELVLTIPRDSWGDRAIVHLREYGNSDLGCSYVESLSDRLRDLSSSRALADLPYTFHRVRVQAGDERAAANRLLRFYDGGTSDRGRIQSVELNAILVPTTTYLGLPFTLGGKNNDYLDQMRVPDAHYDNVKGQGVRIAIVDSGLDKASSLSISDFYDVETGNPIHAGLSGQTDNDGHGTAMAELAAQVAPESDIYIVRVMDRGALTLWNVLAGAGIAAFDCEASVINLSLGFDDFAACGVCGATGSTRSVAFEKLLEGITKSTSVHGGNRSPIYVASVGNEQASSGINSPASYASAVPVGSINANGDRSSFSNYKKGGSFAHYLMAPGGDKSTANTVTEDVGDGGGNKCCGTSVATAYSAGMLALLWSDSRYNHLSRTDFLDAVIRTHCKRDPSQSSDEYGAGLIQYVP